MTSERPVAVVTGGNRGIGLEVCRQLGADGYCVVLGSRTAAKGESAVRSLRDTGAADVHPAELDVDSQPSLDAAVARVAERFGRCDVLVNNAAIDYDTDQRATRVDLERVHHAFETNVFGAWRTTLGFLPLLRRAPHARIVNVSSEAGSLAGMSAGAPGYSISKAALNALTRILAAELRSDGILVNAVCPGWTATDMGGGGRPVEAGAGSVVWAVQLDDSGPTGGFFRDGRPLPW